MNPSHTPYCYDPEFIHLLETESGNAFDHYLGLSDTIDQTDFDAFHQRARTLLNHLPAPPCRLLEVGEAKGYFGTLFSAHGYEVVTLSSGVTLQSDQLPTTDDNFAFEQIGFNQFTDNSQQNFNACLFQEKLPSQDSLDSFNRAWQILQPEGHLILLQEFRRKRIASDSEPTLPVVRHIVRQAEDCGFRLETELDLSSEACNSIKRQKQVLSEHQPGITTAEYSDKLKEYDTKLRCYLLLKFRKQTKPRWHIGLARNEDSEGLKKLFHDSFNNHISPELWAWKYASQAVMNVIAKRNNEVVAHYGGIKRKILYQNQSIDGVQISDVMVSPKERGILTRKGAFFRVAAAFPEYFVGYASATLIGYGFPNMRHMRIAETMKLYSEVGRIEELVWTPQQAKPDKLTGCRELDIDQDAKHIDALWKKMSTDLTDALLGVRDRPYIQHRYLEHPHNRYQVLYFYRRLLGTPLGIAVIHQISAECCRLIDLITPVKNIPSVINKTKLHARNLGCKELIGWGSEQTIQHLASTNPERRTTDICIPTSIWTDGPAAETLKGKWWLMYGDTDFN